MLSSLVLCAADTAGEAPLTPVYLPRSIKLGVFINPPQATPSVRLAWEGAIVDQPKNMLIWTAAIGTGAGVGVQSPMLEHYQHTVMLGVGYRSDRPLLFWGFQVTSGPLWYRASYKPGSIYGFESRVVGYIEGRVQLGVRVAPHLRLAAYFGYASPFVFLRQYPGNTFVGGIDAGLVVDWR